MSRQTYKGDVQWIVVDDGETPEGCTMWQEVIRPRPYWRPGENTQCRNLMAALPYIKYDKVIHIENDDYYHPRYLEVMDRRLDEAQLVGERSARYYNVKFRAAHVCPNDRHASLCQTGFRREIIEPFRVVCSRGHKWVDIELWKNVPVNSRMLYGHTGLCIGIKGLPGRPGIGVGHKSEGIAWIPDPDLTLLRSWIGEDAEVYRQYGEK